MNKSGKKSQRETDDLAVAAKEIIEKGTFQDNRIARAELARFHDLVRTLLDQVETSELEPKLRTRMEISSTVASPNQGLEQALLDNIDAIKLFLAKRLDVISEALAILEVSDANLVDTPIVDLQLNTEVESALHLVGAITAEDLEQSSAVDLLNLFATVNIPNPNQAVQKIREKLKRLRLKLLGD